MKQQVLIIGSGKRVQGAIIPALWCLQDTHEIAGIYSRSLKSLSFFSGKLKINTITDLEKIHFKDINLIVMAITPREVPAVLKKLSEYETKHIVLMIDTPVLPFKNIFAARLFKNFKKVFASEDTIALPPFVLARKLIDEHKIGNVKNIYFFHNGYVYHAAASLKILAGSPLSSIRNRKFYRNIMRKEFSFKNNIRAVMYEPRDYSKGKFLIEGETGCIADYAYTKKNTYQIGYVHKNNLYQSLTLNRAPVSETPLDALYKKYADASISDLSLMNSMKIRGLMELIVESEKTHSSFHYTPKESMMDAASMNISSKFGYFKFIL